MCFSSFSNDISLVFIAVCAHIKDIYFKVDMPDLTDLQNIKDSFYSCKKTIFPPLFSSLLALGIETLPGLCLTLQLQDNKHFNN